MEKIIFQDVISKYYLGGLIESVKWEINNKSINIKFVSPNKDMIGELNSSNFELENNKIGIFNTSQLNKLISVTSGDLKLDLFKQNNISTKLQISDSQFKVLYSLSDIVLVPNVGKVTEPKVYDLELDLTKENINALIKSKNAILENDNLKIESDFHNNISFIFGENTEHSNKISYSLPHNKDINIDLQFNSDIFKEILSVNKDMINCKLFLSKEGLMKLVFNNDEIDTKYFLVCKAGL